MMCVWVGGFVRMYMCVIQTLLKKYKQNYSDDSNANAVRKLFIKLLPEISIVEKKKLLFSALPEISEEEKKKLLVGMTDKGSNEPNEEKLRQLVTTLTLTDSNDFLQQFFKLDSQMIKSTIDAKLNKNLYKNLYKKDTLITTLYKLYITNLYNDILKVIMH